MSETTQEDIPMLTVDGVNYAVNSLPPDVQEMIMYYQTWQREHEDQKLAAFKTEAAMRAISVEIQNRVRAAVTAAADAKDAAQGSSEAANEEVISEGGTVD